MKLGKAYWVARLKQKRNLHFVNLKTRNSVFKLLKDAGHNVRRTSSRGQQLHPMYVEDYGRDLSEEEKGFGNLMYKTYFPVLYNIELRWY